MEQTYENLIPKKKKKQTLNKTGYIHLCCIYLLITILICIGCMNLVAVIKINNYIEDQHITAYIHKLKHLIDEACKQVKC